jgi:phosphoadenosine phosphosulfate reductase
MQPLATAQEVEIEIDQLEAQTEGVDAHTFVELSADFFGQRLAMTTSFGIHSAVMLHLVTQVIPKVPIIWIDTGYLFAETYQFAETLSERLDLNLKVYQSAISPARMEAICGRLWNGKIEALNRYDRIRKVEPLQRALRELSVKACFSGLRAEQTEY